MFFASFRSGRHPVRRLGTLLIAGTSVALLHGGCQLFVATDTTQCTTDGDCTSRGGAFAGTACVNRVCVTPSAIDAGPDVAPDTYVDPKWGCLGNVKFNPPSATETIKLRERFVTLLSEDPVTQADIKVCRRLDISCISPQTTGKTDDNGYVEFTIPKYFDGFLDIAPPASFPNMVPALVYLSPPPDKDSDLTAEIPTNISPHLASATELNLLLGQVGSSLDPALGHLLGLAVDCTNTPTPGVAIHASVVDKKTIPYYVVNGLPSTTAQETSGRGEAGFMNLPTGSETIESSVPSLGKRVGANAILIRAGTITYLPMGPTP